MDCMDCHNRPAHTFEPSAERAVDNAIALGQIPRDLPFARREAVAVLKTEYRSRDAAFAGMAAKLLEMYRPRTTDAAALARIIAGVQGLYALYRAADARERGGLAHTSRIARIADRISGK